MKISYAITVCNELKEIQTLLNFLKENKREEDEIVILFDKQGGNAEVWSYLQHTGIKNITAASFKNHFADWKNYLNSLCNGDYIFQIDADEIPSKFLIEKLPLILENNEVDLFLVPRVNTVEGLTDEHIQKWRWNVNEQGWVNWPDLQMRIYINDERIKWQNKVHEVIVGTESHTQLPLDESFAIYHPKAIDRQEKQNEYYSTL
jgi:hypothetical protein